MVQRVSIRRAVTPKMLQLVKNARCELSFKQDLAQMLIMHKNHLPQSICIHTFSFDSAQPRCYWLWGRRSAAVRPLLAVDPQPRRAACTAQSLGHMRPRRCSTEHEHSVEDG